MRLSLCVNLSNDIIDNNQCSGNKNKNLNRQEKRRKYSWLWIEKLRKMHKFLIKTSAQMTCMSTNSFPGMSRHDFDVWWNISGRLSGVRGFWWVTARPNDEKSNGKRCLDGRKGRSVQLEPTLGSWNYRRRPLIYTRNLLDLKSMPKLRTWQGNVHLLKGCTEYKYLSWYLPNEPNRTRHYERCTTQIPNINLIDPGRGTWLRSLTSWKRMVTASGPLLKAEI